MPVFFCSKPSNLDQGVADNKGEAVQFLITRRPKDRSQASAFRTLPNPFRDKFNKDKEFREFLYGIVNKGLGSSGKKAGIPPDKIASFAEKLYEAGKSRERSAKLEGFQEEFLILKKEMGRSLLEFENRNSPTFGIEESFIIGWNDFITTYFGV